MQVVCKGIIRAACTTYCKEKDYLTEEELQKTVKSLLGCDRIAPAYIQLFEFGGKPIYIIYSDVVKGKSG